MRRESAGGGSGEARREKEREGPSLSEGSERMLLHEVLNDAIQDEMRCDELYSASYIDIFKATLIARLTWCNPSQDW